MKISTSWAWLITSVIAAGAFILRTFKPEAPLELLYGFLISIGGAYGFRRYKLKISNDGGNNEGINEG